MIRRRRRRRKELWKLLPNEPTQIGPTKRAIPLNMVVLEDNCPLALFYRGAVDLQRGCCVFPLGPFGCKTSNTVWFWCITRGPRPSLRSPCDELHDTRLCLFHVIPVPQSTSPSSVGSNRTKIEGRKALHGSAETSPKGFSIKS